MTPLPFPAGSLFAKPRLRLWRWLPGILTRLYVVVLTIFLLTPIVVVVLASLTATSYLTVPPKGLSFRWFEAVLTSPSYRSAIGTSLFLAGLATIGSTILGPAVAYGLMRYKPWGRNAIGAAFSAPLIIPGVVTGVALLQFLTVMNMRGGMGPLVALHILTAMPYVIRSVSSSIAGADPLVEHAAWTLGSSPLKTFFLVTLPLIKPGVVTGAIFAFIISMGEVAATIFVLTVRQTTLPVKIFSMVEFGVDPSIAAVSTMMILLTAVLLLLAEKWTGFHRFI
jgi:putative spermidine/putrescine transport system permease protein